MPPSEYSEWSGWSWNQQYNCWERYRLHVATQQYEWGYDQGTQVAATPRNSEVDNVASAFAKTNIGSRSFPSTGIGGGIVQDYPEFVTPIRPGDLDHERSDRSFKVQKSKEFTFGRIFKVLWSEPQGSGGTEITVVSNDNSKIRRFVIIKTFQGHSTCLPILTYGNRATLKPGCHPGDHAVIHSSRDPVLRDGEIYITKQAIRCIMDVKHHKLDPASRLNYAKVYTVEHNVKVQFVARVAESHEQRIVVAYNETHPSIPDRPVSGTSLAETTSFATGPESYSLHSTSQGPVTQSNWPPRTGAPGPSNQVGDNSYDDQHEANYNPQDYDHDPNEQY